MNVPTAPVALAECPVLSPERQHLWEAANYIEKRGWRPDAGGCVIHALVYSRQWPMTTETTQQAMTLLGRRIGTHSLPQWSDSSDQQTVDHNALLRQIP